MMALEKIQCAAGKEVVSVIATCYKQLFCGFFMLGAISHVTEQLVPENASPL